MQLEFRETELRQLEFALDYRALAAAAPSLVTMANVHPPSRYHPNFLL